MRRHKTWSHKVSYSTIFEEISAYEERNKVSGRKESKALQKSRFEGLPSIEELAKLTETIRKSLVHAVSDDFTYLDLASLSIFLIIIDNNCRLGTVLKITTEDYDKIEVGAIIRSHEHTTGYVYGNLFEKTEETKALNSKCHELFTKETGLRKPKLLFPNEQGREVTTTSANFNSALSKHFETPNYKVGPNIFRKVWETLMLARFQKSCSEPLGPTRVTAKQLRTVITLLLWRISNKSCFEETNGDHQRRDVHFVFSRFCRSRSRPKQMHG